LDIDEEVIKLAEVIILRNALDYNGKARLDSVISKILGSKPEIKTQIKTIMPKVKEILEHINSLSFHEQRNLLINRDPQILEPKKGIEKN
jgi:glutamyl-tRNA synthetase